MKALSSVIFLVVLSFFNSFSQDQIPVTPVRKSPVPLNRSAEALGISGEVQKKIKAMTNPPVNIALFAVDRRTEQEAGNSDVVMIISIDQLNKKIKMSSIMRDTYVKIEGKGMDKINAAFAIGGPQLAIKTINQNFDLDIKDYMNVDFYGAAKIVDALGGIILNVKAAELPYLNNYLDELAIYDQVPAVHVDAPGLQKLNGKQTVAYTRIRAVGNGDAERTERQRSVLISIFDKIKGSGQEIFPVFATEILPNIETSMANFTLLNFAGNILKAKNNVIEQARFPLDKESAGKRINNIWYLSTDLKKTTRSLHHFIYNTPKKNNVKK
ncbi:LCP family protein [Pedobacter caeni]|uniref:Transcriptional attenuator, LytR family n=1 Tax=Pedobacter caeni TaxID=288992 RepID=A0A1M5PNR1_9SPHI|nr:LCP family protein [Pedobacter caeni]SHH02873.1 transcriptional attenuator, LytR family [Pedobacter caeni]